MLLPMEDGALALRLVRRYKTLRESIMKQRFDVTLVALQGRIIIICGLHGLQ
jgi:hypothetical protein